MERSCDCCPNPAVVHETIVRDGVRTEVHLCAEHAIDRGYLLPTNVGQALVVGKLLEKATQAAARSVKACPSCAMTMQGLRETGLVGCSDCYRHFEEELAAIIGRTQEGAATHVGRHPAQAMPDSGVTLQSLTLRGVPERAAEVLSLQGVEVDQRAPTPSAPALTAVLQTPRGEVTLHSAAP